jgi:hypothetical protein
MPPTGATGPRPHSAATSRRPSGRAATVGLAGSAMATTARATTAKAVWGSNRPELRHSTPLTTRRPPQTTRKATTHPAPMLTVQRMVKRSMGFPVWVVNLLVLTTPAALHVSHLRCYISG